MHRSVVAIVVGLALVSLSGCGGSAGRDFKTGTVTGKLTLNGGAVPAGTQIQFIADTGDAAGGEVASDGSFTIQGVPVGACKVMVTPGAPSAAAAGELSPEEAMKLASGIGPSGEGADPSAFASDASVPAKYKDFSTSGVTITVKEGSNDFSLDMKP